MATKITFHRPDGTQYGKKSAKTKAADRAYQKWKASMLKARKVKR